MAGPPKSQSTGGFYHPDVAPCGTHQLLFDKLACESAYSRSLTCSEGRGPLRGLHLRLGRQLRRHPRHAQQAPQTDILPAGKSHTVNIKNDEVSDGIVGNALHHRNLIY